MTPYLSLPVPPGAKSHGFTQCIGHVKPTLDGINLGPYGNETPADLYSGGWMTSPVPNPDFYSMQDGHLALHSPGSTASPAPGVTYAGSLATASTKSTPGKFPLLPAAKGFYVRSRHRVRPPKVGNFFAFWAEPIQHNQAKQDARSGVECWLELDFNEGGGGGGRGEGAGMWGGIVFWKGTYPNYKKTIWKNPYTDLLFNPGEWHDYGFALDPKGIGSWYLDDTFVGSQNFMTGPDAVSTADFDYIKTHSYYLIWNGTTSPPNLPYTAEIDTFSAFVP